MSSTYQPLQPATLVRNAQGLPCSPRYDDVYHPAPGDGIAQSRRVFLAGNGLPGRWAGRETFTVCETGFGLGLNFLALWQAWRDDPARPRRLHMLSVEAHPFSRDDLATLLRECVPDDLQSCAQALLAQWPPLLPGLHRLEFEGGNVTLTLGLGLAESVVPQWDARADAYFLDGFAPAGNPQMWTPALLRALSDLSAPDATLATWCSVGAVRRALDEVGFAVTRREGEAGKRHVTVGVRKPEAGAGARAQAVFAGAHEAVIVGGGPAGAGVAQSLALRGWRVTVVDEAAAAAGMTHAGHLAAACTPLIARDDNLRARLSRAGSRRALARWQDLPETGAPRVCGTVQLARDAGRAADLAGTLAVLAFPSSWVRAVSQEEAGALAGVPVRRGGIFFAEGMLVRPQGLVAGLLATPGVRRLAARVARVTRSGPQWRVIDETGQVLAEAPVLVLANAAAAPALLRTVTGNEAAWPSLAGMHRLAGEVAHVPADALAGGPRCVVGGEGYLLPGVDGLCVAGSTYVHGAERAERSAEGRDTAIGKALGLVDLPLAGDPGAGGWAGWRAVLPGRLPAIGEVPGAAGLWLATGYASRGFCWSALAGDLVGARLMGEPIPLERDLQAALGPR
ncbi:tRNA (5-methylaminomethyl-2-thiouridylate)-methyltransferase / FAD-dependent cmnm(5)s(2)U34 oxidoreductase [plant metagenome]|uniref:tRNA (5-methylaminomethyl-2-thiouridylate)-methyltransferase / FAD-dependent cmnm(5)s(2)U34 oxidoreductase n=1 Tax=plant metagenome TaxID=1297885 RepID=A0A484T3N6_9ZZZZ